MELRRNLYSRPRPTVSSNRISASSPPVTMLFDRRNGSNQRTLMTLTRLLGNQDFSEKNSLCTRPRPTNTDVPFEQLTS